MNDVMLLWFNRMQLFTDHCWQLDLLAAHTMLLKIACHNQFIYLFFSIIGCIILVEVNNSFLSLSSLSSSRPA